MHRINRLFRTLLMLVLGLAPLLGHAQAVEPSAPASVRQPILVLGPGDEVTVHVFGQANMDTTTYIADDGTLQVPLAGPVHVAGLSPSGAAHAIEAALQKGQFLVHPHVSITIVKSSSQEVSVLGQVSRPGMFPIQSNTTLLDLLAQAGGETTQGADTIYILRTGADGAIHRLTINLEGLAETGAAPEAAQITLRGGDQVYVPRAPEIYVMGEVHTPGRFRLSQGMTVLEAVAHAGGVTDMGSTHRILIRRPLPDGKYREISANLTDTVAPGDIVTVRERIF
ncbi:MAG: polysaccharide biosynthesis/export family protein [Steroidobacteraceae bacterium]